jgi:hypothetical protein
MGGHVACIGEMRNMCTEFIENVLMLTVVLLWFERIFPRLSAPESMDDQNRV